MVKRIFKFTVQCSFIEGIEAAVCFGWKVEAFYLWYPLLSFPVKYRYYHQWYCCSKFPVGAAVRLVALETL